MQMLKGGIMIFIITLSLLQITSSIAVIREDLFSVGIKKTTPGGPNAKHNPHHLLAHRYLIEVKGNIPGESFNPIQKQSPQY
ncbi:hypothetical protein N665_2221s0004 [Sinapis alba]|nr:hypothetical protein N665_2221s0004 [Sinapis alba]